MPDSMPHAAVQARPIVRPAGRAIAVVLGAALVALSAQVAIPVPLSPVPFTLQALAVLIVGGVLGPAAGAASLALYLAAGILGMPVFAGGTAGIARLLGPTGGYLLAFPVAAAVTGHLVGGKMNRGRWGRALLAAFAGILVIHAGGIAQLSILAGSLTHGMRVTVLEMGVLPFLLVDLVKVAIAAIAIAGAGPRFRSLR